MSLDVQIVKRGGGGNVATDGWEEPSIYVGETNRSIFERGNEHWLDSKGLEEESHMINHCLNTHKGEGKPSFKDSLSHHTVNHFWFCKPSISGLGQLHQLFLQSTAVKFLAT
jgi:hypothetical protein